MPRISAAEAANRINQYMKDKTGKNRRVPPVNEAIQDITRKTVHVFNVGPWGFRENAGSFGYKFIPACEVGSPMEWERLKAPVTAPGVYVPDHWEEGEQRVTDPRTQYAAAQPLPALMMEPMPDTQEDCKWNMQDTGEYFADEILLKIGIGHSYQNSNVRKGVFRAAGKIPTEIELQKARGELSKYMSELVLEADRAWAQGPQKAEQIIRTEVHHVCALWLNLKDRAWLRGTDPQAQAECPACGEDVKSAAMKCKGCGFILDKAKYEAAQKEGLFA